MKRANAAVVVFTSALMLTAGSSNAFDPQTSSDAAHQISEQQGIFVAAQEEEKTPPAPSSDVQERAIPFSRPGMVAPPPRTFAPPSPFYGCNKGTCTCTNQEDCHKMQKLDVCASQLTGNSDGTFSCQEKQ